MVLELDNFVALVVGRIISVSTLSANTGSVAIGLGIGIVLLHWWCGKSSYNCHAFVTFMCGEWPLNTHYFMTLVVWLMVLDSA